MTRLNGKLLNIDTHAGVSKEGKPFFTASCLVLDEDNEVSTVRMFDRDQNLAEVCKSLKIGSDYVWKIEKSERLQNRTYDCLGMIVLKK